MPAAPFNYDVTTSRGLVRLLALDSVGAYARYNDNEIDAFLALNAGQVQLAAAAALDTSAASIALIEGHTQFAGIVLDGSKAAVALSGLAAELRRQVHEGEDGLDASPINWAEMVTDPFSYRDRLVNEMLRQST